MTAFAKPHDITQHILREPNGGEMASMTRDVGLAGPAIVLWVQEVIEGRGYDFGAVDWCEANDEIELDHLVDHQTGEIIATLHVRYIPAVTPLGTHRAAGKSLEAA